MIGALIYNQNGHNTIIERPTEENYNTNAGHNMLDSNMDNVN
jgi:hypothetical protein